MNIHTKHPLIKILTAILLIGALAFAVGHTVAHADHDIQCVVCVWMSGLVGLMSLFVIPYLRYGAKYYYLSIHNFSFSLCCFLPLGRSPPVVS